MSKMAEGQTRWQELLAKRRLLPTSQISLFLEMGTNPNSPVLAETDSGSGIDPRGQCPAGADSGMNSGCSKMGSRTTAWAEGQCILTHWSTQAAQRRPWMEGRLLVVKVEVVDVDPRCQPPQHHDKQ
jgi:hypothetical protein